MEVLVRNAEGNVSDHDREYAAKKLGKLGRFFNHATKVEMVHKEEKSVHRVEITVHADGLHIRGEESDGSVRAAIDKAIEKIEGRLRKHKSKIVERHKRKGSSVPKGLVEEPIPDDEEAPPIVIAERKHFLLKPMSAEEAALMMEMVGHPFFVFKNENSKRLEVLYKRRDGKYGLLQPEG